MLSETGLTHHVMSLNPISTVQKRVNGLCRQVRLRYCELTVLAFSYSSSTTYIRVLWQYKSIPPPEPVDLITEIKETWGKNTSTTAITHAPIILALNMDKKVYYDKEVEKMDIKLVIVKKKRWYIWLQVQSGKK